MRWFICGVIAVLFWSFTVRAVMLGVAIRPDRIVARGLGRTTAIRWEEMERVEAVGLVNGAASLGGYVLWPRRPTRMERQAAKIEQSLTRWREQEPTSD